MDESLISESAPTRKLLPREHMILRYLGANNGLGLRQDIKAHLAEIAGFSCSADSFRFLERAGLIRRLRPGVYCLPDYQPPKLGATTPK